MTGAQDRARLRERLAPGHPMHVHAAAVELRGPLDESRLRAAVRDDVTLVRPDGDPAELARAPFDLAGPLWRVLLLRRDAHDHVLVVAAHQAAADEGTVALALAEIGWRYSGIPVAAGSPPMPDDLSDLDYWHRHLAGATPLELPADRPRPAVPGFRYSTVDHPLTGITPYSSGVPPIVLLLAGCHALVAAYTRHDDVLIGTTVLGHPVALRTALADDPTFTELVTRVHATYTAAVAHRSAPIDAVVARLRPARTAGRDPLFGLTVHVAEPAPAVSFAGLVVTPLSIGHGHVPLDVDITLRGNVLTATYDQELFDAGRIEAMLAHLARILVGAAARPDAHLSELPLLDADELATATAHAHGAALSYPDSTIHRLVAEQTARTPDAPAVRGGDRVLTYAELDDAARRIAGHLHAQGIGPGSLVAVLLDRDVDLISTLLGVLRTGAGYVPLDSRNPPARLATILDAARARLAVTTERFRPVLPAGLPTVCLDRDRTAIDDAGPIPDPPEDPGSLCHVVFTSGSTGTPKGVAASHRNVVSFTMELLDILGAGEFRRTLFTTPLSFDACLVELWTPLFTGGTLVVADNLLVADPADLDGITLANAVPSVLTEFLRVGRFPDTMRTLTIGAEPLSPALVAQVFEQCAADRIYNIYGPTETTAYITAKRLDRGDFGRITIGTPIPNSSAFVLDRYGRQAPVGVPGELLLGGPGVALGYLHRPDLTAQVFGDTDGRRTYRTGDLVARRCNGELDYLRRLDNQVKVRGFRIELGEIESCLARHPAVRAAAAAVRTDPSGEPRLVGYVAAGDLVATKDKDVVADLTAACQRDLPAYMVPDAIVVLPKIPLSPTGKVDRRGLPDPAWSRPGEPSDPVRRELVSLWSVLLGIDAPTGDFFALGGDSATAVRMIDECNQRFGVTLPALTAFTAPTLAALSDEIERAVLDLTGLDDVTAAIARLRARGLATAGAIPHRPAGVFVTSVGQEQRWLADRLTDTDHRHLHHVVAAVRIADPPAALVFRHETLRGTFHASDNGVRADLRSDVTIPLTAEPLSAGELSSAMAAELRQPFDLTVGPPIRARLWRIDDGHVLMLTAHRIACDARSLDLLLAGATGATGIDYPDFAVHQRNQLDTGALDDDIAYWRDRLDGVTGLELGMDRPRPAVPSLAARRVTATLDPDTISRLRKADPDPVPVLLAGVHAVLARYTRQDDIVVGTVVDGRDLPECRTMIGPFADILPLRTEVAGDPTFAELIDRVDQALRGVAAHRRVPFATLVDRLAPPHDASRHPYFQIVCHVVDEPVDPQRIPVSTDVLHHDLAITVDLSDVDAPKLVADYATDLFDEWRIEALLRHIGNVLTAVADDTAIPVSALPLLEAAESAALSTFSRGPIRPYHRGPVHQLILDRVRRHPDTPAAVFGDTSMTYRELGRRAGLLANELQSLGVGGDDVVGIALPRGLDAPAAVVGVLAAGGVFLPVDPTHPVERIGFVFADSAMSALVTVSEVADGLPTPTGCPVLLLDELWSDDTEPEPWAELATPDSGAYLLYTSGSTGQPKGVLVEHHAIACYLDFFGEAFELGVGDRVLQFCPLTFDVGVGELLATLAYGATAVPVPHDDMINPAGLAALLRKAKVSRAGFTPSMLTRVPTGDYPDLTHLMVIGEVCGPELVNTWQAPGRMFMNMYGPTEAAVGCTYEICAHRHWPAQPPIGAPMPNRRIYIVDRHGNPAPRGVPGELLVAGDGLARGYHNRPELTRTQFVPDPFEPHGRAYRSGDLAAWTETGRIQFLGRIDTQVKLNGQRIELEEIETVLTRHPQVRQAVVTLRHDTPSGDGLVAYVVCQDPENPPAAAELRAHLASFLPSIMVPAGYLMLPTLPLSPTGKANRAALPPAPQESFAGTAFTAPRTDTEHHVAAIYTDVLGRPKIGATDDFFALGGSSLQVVLVLNRIGDRFGVQLPTQVFYTDPAVHAVARAIEDTVLGLVSDDELALLLAQSRSEEESGRDRVDP